MLDEMDLLGRLKDVEPLRAEAFDQARAVLREALAVGENPGLAPRPAGRHARERRWGVWGAVGLGAVAAAVAVALVVTSTPPAAKQSAATGNRPAVGATKSGTQAAKPKPSASSALNQPLMRLADYIEVHDSHPAGDASLVIRNQTNGAGQVTGGGADLFADSGTYYYAPTKSDLPADVAGHLTANDGGVFAREVAAALYAVHGNIATARDRMHWAPLPPGTKPLTLAQTNAQQKAMDRQLHKKFTPQKPLSAEAEKELTDSWIWHNSLEAINGAAGNPQVRVGILRLMSTMPRVIVTSATTDGQPTLTLTDTWPELLGGQSTETLTINASTGIPVISRDLVKGYQEQDATTTYQVSRVMLADIAAGKF